MPHQCLKCGKVFPDGSPMILKGCQVCSGTRFFFTEKPLSDEERKKLTELASKDIKTLVKDVLTTEKVYTKKDIESLIKGKKEWIKIEPKTEKYVKKGKVVEVTGKRISGVRKVKPVKIKEVKPTKKTEERKEEVAEKEKTFKETKTPIETKEVKEKAPEVVNIVESGVYEIDVESLLEKSPVIVRRDGTYLVHLPSLFGKVEEKE
ncbi:MAG: Zn-ribbon domain-containing protein [Candidatus Thermoplasmatota archaeon]|nr:Zn-ribbon domain-containing protein [Candidatus Thermoplasmatota archaeon]